MQAIYQPIDIPPPLHFDPDDLGRYLCREDCTVYLDRTHVSPIGPPRWALIKSGRYIAGGWWHIDRAIMEAQKYLREAE